MSAASLAPPPDLFDEDDPRFGASDDTDAEPPPAPWGALIVPDEWYTRPPPPRTWLLRDSRTTNGDGVLPLGKVGQIVAEGGAGKTMALAQLAVAVATGTRWLGALDVACPGRVFLALGEEDAEEVHRRLFNAVRSSRAPNPPPGSIVVLPLAGVACAMLETDDRGNAVEAPFLPWLRSHLGASPDWRLVVVDPLSRFAGPDAETDNASATRFVQALESIAGATGATTLAAHHTTKLSRAKGGSLDGTAGRGSSALFDGSRWQCALAVESLKLDDADTRERLGEVVSFAVTKSNYGRKPDPITLRRDLDNGGALVPLDEADLETARQARGRDPARETKQAAKAAELDAREAAEDGAIDRTVAAQPGVSTRDLVTAVRMATRCGGDRAAIAVSRAAARLDVRPGPRSARLHYPKAQP